jgi:biotin/methionine sulfoxide reductase
MLLDPGASYEFNGRQYKYPDIRLIYWAGGNPFHHHQDLNRLQRAWQKPDTVIVHESWWTPTARHADIVLPATTTLERNDVGGSSRDSFILAMHRAINPSAKAQRLRHLPALAGRRATRRFTENRDDGLVPARLRPGARERRRQGRRAARLPAVLGRLRRAAPATRDYVLFGNFRRDPRQYPLKTPSGRSRSH